MLVRAVVRHDVDDHPEPEPVRLGDQRLGVGERAEQRVDVAVVGDVVAAVGQRGGVPGGEPEGVDAELGEVGSRARTPARSPMPSPLPSAKLRT